MAQVYFSSTPSPTIKFDSVAGKDASTKALVSGTFAIAFAILLIGALGLSGHILMHVVTGSVLTSVSSIFSFVGIVIALVICARAGCLRKAYEIAKEQAKA
jgi:hypothetical protein